MSGSAGPAQGFEPPVPAVLSHYGLAGHIDMPSALTLPDGAFGVTLSQTGPDIRRGTLAFQLTPRLTGAFRYTWLRDFDLAAGGASLYDRSFDLHYQIFGTEDGARPSLALGLRDFGGTSDFGAEYLVYSQRLQPGLLVSLGLGWGRLASHSGFENPLGVLSDRLRERPGRRGMQDTGKIALNRFFRGDAALFAGLSWQASPQLQLSAEYSSDAMREERAILGYAYKTPLSLRADYQMDAGRVLSLSLANGGEVSLSYAQLIHPNRPPFPSGREPAPPAVSSGDSTLRAPALPAALRRQGLRYEGHQLREGEASLALSNPLWPNSAQAIGRGFRLASRSFPQSAGKIRLRYSVKGMQIREITLARADLEALEFAPDGAWQAWLRAESRDAAGLPPLAPWQPRAEAALRPFLASAAFDPDNPLRLDLGLELSADLSPLRGLHFSGALRQRLAGNLEEARRVSNSVLPHVRSDYAEYARAASLTLPWATVEYFTRPGPDYYSRFTLGLLEPMFAGASAELLWAPSGRRLALGAEINHVVQRDFDGRGLGDYRVTTGHLSAYLDLTAGYALQIDAGRYLAGDRGATLTLRRGFENGVSLSLFATLTDAGFDDFGEGAFDKGITLSLPVSWLSGEPGQQQAGLTIRPVQRDGGARLALRNRLYQLTAPARAAAEGQGWAGFWR